MIETINGAFSYKTLRSAKSGLVRCFVATLLPNHFDEVWIEINYVVGQTYVHLNPRCTESSKLCHELRSRDRVLLRHDVNNNLRLSLTTPTRGLATIDFVLSEQLEPSMIVVPTQGQLVESWQESRYGTRSLCSI